MSLYACYAKLFSNLDENAVILTPNHRLSRFVHEQFERYQTERGVAAWESLKCMSLTVWVESLYSSAASHRVPLTDAQAKEIWQHLVKKVDADAIYGQGLVDSAQAAYRRVREWLLEDGDWLEDTDESRILRELFSEYRRYTEVKSLCDSTDVLLQCVDIVNANTVKLPPVVILLGFDDLTPAVEQLLQSCTRNAVEVVRPELNLQALTSVVAIDGLDEEIETACRWALKKQELNPGARVGVVIPNLAGLRTRVLRVFTQYFEPDYISPSVGQRAPSFNISAGQPLAQASVISTAMSILSLNRRNISALDVVALLPSPYLENGESHLHARVLLASRIEEHYVELTPLQLKSELTLADTDGALGGLSENYLNFYRAAGGGPAVNSFKFWAEEFNRLLGLMGWPGERTLDTIEYQQVKQWGDVLEEFGKMDGLLPGLSYQDALAQLNRMLFTPFLPQTATSPVQILGLLEASGMHFDYLWVMGLSDNAWPEPCQPNPLLSIKVQKDKLMPRASVDREYTLAKKITQRLACSAQEVIFSYAQRDGDQEQRLSSLLYEFPVIDKESLNLDSSVMGKSLITGEFEYIEDVHGAALTQDQKKVKGGSAILKDQSACAFRAYVKYRLNAVNAEEKRKGITPLVRGNLIHNALERVWAQLKNSEALQSHTKEDVQLLALRSLELAWAELNAADVGEEIRKIELERAQNLLCSWLELERLRPAFSVDAQESTVVGQVGPLEVQLRLDRLDRLGDGSCAVVDYKTGRTQVKTWLGDRPDEPQVPLYSVLNEGVSAAVYGELSAYEVAAKGIARSTALWPALTEPQNLKQEEFSDWDQLLSRWRLVLSCLADEFDQGYAAVNPKYGNATCRFCDLQSLCRVGVEVTEGADTSALLLTSSGFDNDK